MNEHDKTVLKRLFLVFAIVIVVIVPFTIIMFKHQKQTPTFEDGVRYGIIAHLIAPKEDNLAMLTVVASNMWYEIKVRKGADLIQPQPQENQGKK